MKYLKSYEIKNNKEPIIGMMYDHFDTPVCYIGYNDNKEYPILALILTDDRNDKFYFIEWAGWMFDRNQLTPLNITIEDYIINNNLIIKTMNAFEHPTFSSGGCKKSKLKINEFEKRLLNNELIKLAIDTNKYNL